MTRSPRLEICLSRRVLGGVCAVLFLGCGRDLVDPLEQTFRDFPTDFPVTVSGGTAPTISWRGGPAVSILIDDINRRTLTQQTSWSFSGEGFASPVRYGVMPRNTYCGFVDNNCPNARPLERGIWYMIFVFRSDGQKGVTFVKP